MAVIIFCVILLVMTSKIQNTYYIYALSIYQFINLLLKEVSSLFWIDQRFLFPQLIPLASLKYSYWDPNAEKKVKAQSIHMMPAKFKLPLTGVNGISLIPATVKQAMAPPRAPTKPMANQILNAMIVQDTLYGNLSKNWSILW